MKSLQSRLGSGLLLSLIIAFSVLWVLVSINIQILAEDYIASRLKHDSETLLNRLSFDEQGRLQLDTDSIDLIYKQPFSGHYYVLSSGDQHLISRSLWDQGLQHKKLAVGQQQRTYQPGPQQQSLLVLSAAYKKQGRELTISIGEDLNPINESINRFKYHFAVLALLMLFVLVILQIFILRRSLLPLNKVQDEIKQLQQGLLDKLSGDFPAELQPLIDEVNHLLELMQQRLRRSRDALGDLAHAIKKPLTVIKQQLEKTELPDEHKQSLLHSLDEIYQISDRILKRARLAGQGHTGAWFSFADDLPDLMKTLQMMYGEKSLQYETDIARDILCPVDREDMLELLGNLLDNASKWAASQVRIRAWSDDVLHIVIEDDGPGAAPEKINELSKRGVRLDEKVQGHGFGLAIVADMVNDYQGTIHFGRSADKGGFQVDISLPLHESI